MRRRRHFVELVLIFTLIAGLAAWHYRKQPPTEDSSYQQLRLQLQREWTAGDLVSCMRTCHQFLTRDPQDPLALRYLGLIAMRQIEPHRARDYFNRGLAGTPAVDTDSVWNEIYGFTGVPRGCLLRERARLAVMEHRWTDAIRDAEEAKRLLGWSADGDLARDVWCCAQYGAGNTTLAQEEYPELYSWRDSSIQALLVQHSRKLKVNDDIRSEEQPLWHPKDCPLCR